jgi:hypothetical protein
MLNTPLTERLYTNCSMSGEPSAAENKEHVLECADLLRRSTFGSDEDREVLADLIENCDPGHRCGSAACLMCGTAAKQFFVECVDILWPEPTPLNSYTLIAPTFQRPLGNLDSIGFESIRSFTRNWLRSAGFGKLKALGFIDLCHSIDCRTGCEEWTPHLHMLTPVDGSQGLTAALNSALDSKGRVPRPVRREVVRDRNWQVTYVFKPRPQRAVRYATYSANARPTKYWLKRPQQVEALLWLGRASALDRAVLINLDPLLPPGKSGSRLTASRRDDIGRKWGATQP